MHAGMHLRVQPVMAALLAPATSRPRLGSLASPAPASTASPQSARNVSPLHSVIMLCERVRLTPASKREAPLCKVGFRRVGDCRALDAMLHNVCLRTVGT